MNNEGKKVLSQNGKTNYEVIQSFHFTKAPENRDWQ